MSLAQRRSRNPDSFTRSILSRELPPTWEQSQKRRNQYDESVSQQKRHRVIAKTREEPPLIQTGQITPNTKENKDDDRATNTQRRVAQVGSPLDMRPNIEMNCKLDTRLATLAHGGKITRTGAVDNYNYPPGKMKETYNVQQFEPAMARKREPVSTDYRYDPSVPSIATAMNGNAEAWTDRQLMGMTDVALDATGETVSVGKVIDVVRVCPMTIVWECLIGARAGTFISWRPPQLIHKAASKGRTRPSPVPALVVGNRPSDKLICCFNELTWDKDGYYKPMEVWERETTTEASDGSPVTHDIAAVHGQDIYEHIEATAGAVDRMYGGLFVNSATEPDHEAVLDELEKLCGPSSDQVYRAWTDANANDSYFTLWYERLVAEKRQQNKRRQDRQTKRAREAEGDGSDRSTRKTWQKRSSTRSSSGSRSSSSREQHDDHKGDNEMEDAPNPEYAQQQQLEQEEREDQEDTRQEKLQALLEVVRMTSAKVWGDYYLAPVTRKAGKTQNSTSFGASCDVLFMVGGM